VDWDRLTSFMLVEKERVRVGRRAGSNAGQSVRQGVLPTTHLTLLPEVVLAPRSTPSPGPATHAHAPTNTTTPRPGVQPVAANDTSGDHWRLFHDDLRDKHDAMHELGHRDQVRGG
jgi:hypothetical protein